MFRLTETAYRLSIRCISHYHKKCDNFVFRSELQHVWLIVHLVPAWIVGKLIKIVKQLWRHHMPAR